MSAFDMSALGGPGLPRSLFTAVPNWYRGQYH